MSYQEYRPQRFTFLPPVVKNLLIINGLFYMASLAFHAQFNLDLTDYLGLHYFSSELFKPYQLVSYMFMHGSLDHVFFNMFALWMFGYSLENYWGSKRFLTYYMITGIGAALIYLGYESFQFHEIQTALDNFVINPSAYNYVAILNSHFSAFYDVPQVRMEVAEFVRHWSLSPQDATYAQQAIKDIHQLMSFKADIPMVGASGSVYGVLLAFGMLFPNALLYVYFLFPIRAKYFVILYGALELYLGIANNPGDNVAHFAHLGGMLFGIIMILYWKRKNRHYF